MVTVVRNYLQTCSHAAYTNCGYYSRAAFILFRASDCAATIRGRHLSCSELLTVRLLFEGGVYSKKYSSWISHSAPPLSDTSIAQRRLACTSASLQNLVWWETYTLVEGNLCGYNTEFWLMTRSLCCLNKMSTTTDQVVTCVCLAKQTLWTWPEYVSIVYHRASVWWG